MPAFSRHYLILLGFLTLFGVQVSWGAFDFEPIEGVRVLNLSETQFYVADAEQPPFSDPRAPAFAFDAIIQNEVLFLNINTVDDAGRRAPHLRAAKLFERMMKHFQDSHQKIHAIRGYWVHGTNLKMFLEQLKAGKSEHEAALSTWTGRQAARFGYSDVTIHTMDDPFGSYPDIIVYFTTRERGELCRRALL